MKKLLLVSSLILVSASICFANLVGIEVKKSVNSGYEITLPIILDAQSKLPFLPKTYLKAQPVFSAPRGEFFTSMKLANHERFDLVIGSGIQLLGGNLEIETGGAYYWGENNSKIAEGWEWNNAARFYYKF